MTKSYSTPRFLFPSPALTASALVFFAVLEITLRWPVFALFNTHLLGGSGGDTNLYFWLVTTFPRNIQELGWFETNAFSPYSDTLAWSDNFLFPSLIFSAIRLFSVNDIAAWNILILFAQYLNGVSVYALARKLGAKFPVAVILGSLFLSSTYFSEHLGHPQLQFFFFIPLALNLFLTLIGSPGIFAGLRFAVILLLCFLTTVYYAIIIALICAVFFLLQLLATKKLSKKVFLNLLLSGLLCGLLLSPFVMPYLGIKKLFGARGLHEFFHFGLSALSFVSAAPISSFYESSSLLSHSEAHFFWGFATIFIIGAGAIKIWKVSPGAALLSLAALILADPKIAALISLPREWRLYAAAILSWLSIILFIFRFCKSDQKTLTSCLACTALIVIQITLGPLGYSDIKILPLGVFNIFYSLFPGLDSLRAISRLGSVVILLLALASIPILNRLGKMVLVLLALILIEAKVSSFPLAPLPEAPAIFEKVSQLSNRSDVFLISPLSGTLDKNNQIISWSEVAQINSDYLVALRQSAPLLMNGYSGQRPKTLYDLPRIMQRFPSEAALEKLEKFANLKYVVILGSRIEGFNQFTFPDMLSKLGERVKIIAQDGPNFIIELKRSKQTPATVSP